jgi:hypothetical protein
MNYPYRVTSNSFIKVADGQVVGVPFTLPENYRLDNGDVVANVALLSAAEKRAIGLYAVVESVPAGFNPDYQMAAPVYVVGENTVAIEYIVTDMPLAQLQQARIGAVYAHAKSLLDAASAGYSAAEIATFPMLQAEVLHYNASNVTIGPMMQAVIDRGRHTAATLAALLTPKINMQAAVLSARDAHVEAIMSLSSPAAVANYAVTDGW